MNKFSIKSPDTIKTEFFKRREIIYAINDKLQEIERLVIDSMAENKNSCNTEISFHEYNFDNIEPRVAAQFIAFHVIKTLSENKYTFKFRQTKNMIQIIFNLKKKITLEKKLEDFFDKNSANS